MSTAEHRAQRRGQSRETQIIKERKQDIQKYRDTIRERLDGFRENRLSKGLVDKYNQKLEEHGLNPTADLNRIHSVDNLSRRARLLPPPPVYQHHRNSRHPSVIERRAVKGRTFAGHTREYMEKQCPNDKKVMNLTNFMPPPDGGTHIKRYKPENMLQFHTEDGTPHCVAKTLLKYFVKNGYTAAPSYQNDSYGDHWPEITNVGNKEPFIRVPFHLLNDATNNEFPLPEPRNRRLPPSANEY